MRLLVSSLVLGLAWFGAANLALSAVAWLAARIAARRTIALGPGALLFLRLLPASVATLFVTALFLPAHLTFEPVETAESFGVLLLALATLAAVVLGRSLCNVLQVIVSSIRIRRTIREGSLPGTDDDSAYELPGVGGVSLAGVFRTRIIVGSAARDVLTAEELTLAIAHEEAHRCSRDNLKRCLMFCAPDVFGWSCAARQLEQQWRARAECLADSRAVAGDEQRAAHLAAALVKVARLTAIPRSPLDSPVWSTFHEPTLLEARVRRLVSGAAIATPSSRFTVSMGGAVLIVSALFVSHTGAALQVHRVTEALITLLP